MSTARLRRLILPAWVALIGAALSACAGEQLLSVGSTTPETPASASSSPYGASPSAVADTSPMNPLNLTGGPERQPGGREVIANPTTADIMQTGTLPEMSWGRADAPVTVVKYMSLTCPYCRRFHAEVFPAFRQRYVDTGKVRFIIREFPIGKTSGNATIALRCAPPEKYLDLYGRFLAQQAAWVSQEVRPEAIFAVASQVGVTRAQFDACLANQPMINGLRWIKDRGRTLGIIGTPNFFVAGKLVKRVLSLDDLSALVDAALAAPVPGGTAAAAR